MGSPFQKMSQMLLDEGGSKIDPQFFQIPYRYLTKGGQSYVLPLKMAAISSNSFAIHAL